MKSITLCLACVGLSLLTACQSTNKPPVTKNQEVNQQTQYFVEAKVALDKLKQDISQGRKEQLAYFAPNTFSQAITEFDNATEEYMDIGRNGASSLNVFQSDTEQYQEAKQEIINYIALANQKLEFAYSIKETTESTLAETFAQKKLLQNIGALKLYSKEYKKIVSKIDDLVEYIDDGQVTKAQEKQPELLAIMQALEVRTVRKNALSQLDKDIAHIKKKRIAKYAPISHQQLLTARNNADAIITVTPRATEKIENAVSLAKFELAHLHNIVKEINTLKKADDKDYEQYLLANEALLHTVSISLETDDVRDLAITEQIESIALQAGIIKKDLTSANATVLALQSDNNQSSAAVKSLTIEFKNQLANLNNKYNTLLDKNLALNKEVQDKNLELVRLQAYKEAVTEIESKHAAEKALALEIQARKEAEKKAIALKEKAKKDALLLAEKVKKEAEIKALALKEKADKEALALEQKKMHAEQENLASQTTTVDKVAESTENEPSKIESKPVVE